MKRSSEDDADLGTQFGLSSGSSRPEGYIQMQNGRLRDGRVNHHELTTSDALTYLQKVKEVFQDQQEKYEQFLAVMKDFKAQRTNTAGVIERVKKLFKGHNNLIIGFNTFLPKGYEITPNEDMLAPNGDAIQTQKKVDFPEAIRFVNRIKNRFVDDDTVYKSFLDILNMYRMEQKGITEVYQEVSALLVDHLDLLEEFVRFLPPTPTTPANHNDLQSGNPIQRNYEKDSAVERDIDDDVNMTKEYKDQKNPSGSEIREKRNHGEVNGESELDGAAAFIKPQHLHDKRNSVFKAEGPGFSSFGDRTSLKRRYRFEFLFCREVKERLLDHTRYQFFLKLFNIYNSNIVTQEEFQGLVMKSLGEHPDLVEGFYELLEHCENIDGFISSLMNDDSVGFDMDVPRSSKAEKREKEKMQHMLIPRVKDRLRDDYMVKSIQELDLSNCQQCTPSYRHLPDDYPIPRASHRSKLGTEVLNDYWVSVTSGSEDYSFKFMRRNQYEEALFKCEDDRFELDLLIETALSTILRIEELLHKINEKSITIDSPVRIEDHFTGVHLRCIERLYGDHCLDAMDFLRKRFIQSLPVIAIRLKQRKDEWSKTRSGFNNVWAEVYAKNHHNSLDHRSFYFKQQDSKNLSSESLLSEIKGIKEAKRKENAFQMDAIAQKTLVAPTMEFEYSDLDLHGDLHRLLCFSCEEVCSTKEEFDKVMHFWTSFLAPVIGVASEHLNRDGTESVTKYRKQDINEYLVASDKKDGGNSSNCGASCIKVSAKGDSPVDKYSSSGLVCEVGHGTFSNTTQSGKEHHSCMITCKASELKGRAASEIKPITLDVPHSMRGEIGTEVEEMSALSPPKRENNVEDLTRTTASDCAPTEGSGDGLRDGISIVGDNIKGNGYHMMSDETLMNEKEEGELSPTGDSDDGLVPWGKLNLGERSLQYDLAEKGCCSQEAVGENDADAYDMEMNNGYMHAKALGNDSGGDECSRQELDEKEIELNVCDSKVENKAEAAKLDGHKLISSGGVQSSMSERLSATAKPLAEHVPSCSCADERKTARVFYGNEHFYVFFRLHQILYDRLLFAKKSSADSDITKSRRTPGCYSRFMEALYNLLDGTTDNEDFEDDCRALLGNHSYMLFTLDKLIYKLIKQLQTIVADEMDIKLIQLYGYETSRKHQNYADAVYHKNACVLIPDEDLFRFEFSSSPSRVSTRLLGGGEENPETVAVTLDPNFVGYLYSDFLSSYLVREESLGVVLQRNKCKSFAGLDLEVVYTLVILTEEIKISNRLESKLNCKSSKDYYVLGTEDVLFHRRRNRRDLSTVKSRRAELLHRRLTIPISYIP